MSAVSMLTPVQYSNTPMRKLSPDSSLSLEWVYGYESERSRNNIRYNFRGDLVYTVSKYAIVYNFDTHSQNIFTGHTEEIVCLSMHPEGQLVATGDVSPIPRVIVWHSATHEIVFSDRKFHRNGMIHVAFSHDGKLLATIGNDSQHSLAVFRWADNQVLFTTIVNPGVCLACVFMLDNTIAVGGETYLYFWSKSPEGYLRRRGNYSKSTSMQPITCLAQVGNADTIVSGTLTGQLFLWVDRNCTKNVKGHDGIVNSLYSCNHGLLSGGRDHRVRLWTQKLEPGATFDMSNFGVNPSIRSVTMSNDGTSIVIGTRGSNIYEISSIDGSDLRGGPITSGHFVGNLQFVVAHPSKHEFATVGDDRYLRIWDMENHSLLKVAVFDSEARAVAYSPLGDTIVVGLGGDSSLAKCGAYVVINEEDLTVVHEARDSTTPITVVKYSPEGETLAVAAMDGAIYLYAVQDDYELIGRCVRHVSPVTQLDFSADGEWIRSNSVDRDLCFFNSDDASFQSNVASMRDVNWSSHTCRFTWHVKSIHRSAFTGEEVTRVHTPSTSSTYVVSGTNYGSLRLHTFPCIPEDAEYHRYPAHVDSVAGVFFSFDEQRLISIGLKDRAILQWKTHVFGQDEVAADYDHPESEDFCLEAREGSELGEDFIPLKGSVVDGILNLDPSDPPMLEPSTIPDGWVGPVNPPTQHHSIPDMSINLEYVYGYECQDMRNNIRYNKNGDIVYTCSTLGVNMSRTTKAQRFFQRHTDAITSFACSKDGSLVATGQMGHEPFVAVWDSVTCETLSTIAELQMKAASVLSFSSSSKYLCIVSLDEHHTVTVYDWQRGISLSRFYAGSGHILGICFSDDEDKIVTCGVRTIKFWSHVKTREPTCMKPTLGEIGLIQTFFSCVYFAGKPTVGCGDGSLYVFAPTKLRHAVKAHEGTVSAMDVSQDGKLLVTGGKDGAIRIWNETLDCTKEISVDAVINSQCPRIRSVAFSSDGNHLVCGTRGSEIFEVAVRSGSLIGSKPIMQGHGVRELWGLAAHPIKEEFVTSGDDGTVRLWDAKSFTPLKVVTMDTASRAITYSPNGKYIAVGFGFGKRTKGKAAAKEGAFVVLNSSDMKLTHEGKDSNEPIRVVRFSPDSNLLAVGSEDSCIYIYNVKDHFSRRNIITCHKAPIVSIDFNLDGHFIMSTDTSKRMCFSESGSGTHIPSPVTLRDERWATWSSPIGWPLQGIWMCQPQVVMPTISQRSCSGMLMCVGTSGGRLFVSHYPAPERGGFVGSCGHAGPISQIAWIAGDSTIISIGLKDHVVFQWKCIYDNTRESGDEGGLSCEDSDVERNGGREYTSKDIIRRTNNFGETKPWQAVVSPPSNPPVDNVSAPSLNMDLDFAHGLRIGDCRQNIRYNDDGNLVYINVSLGIVYSRDDQKQRVYMGHKFGLISIDVDPSGKIAATGEQADNPELHLWDSRTTQHIITFYETHRKGISCLSFSSSGEFLVSLGQDAMHSFVVMRSPSKRWIDGYIYYSTSVSASKMFWSVFIEGNEYPVAVGGKGTIFFFRRSGTTAERVRGVFGKRRKLQPILCAVEGAASNNGVGERALLTGTVTGHIYVWLHRRVSSTVTAHDAPIYSIAKVWQGFATGAKDGLIKIWSSSLQLLHKYNMMTFTPQPSSSSVYNLRGNNIGSKVAIGMRSGEVFEVSLSTHSKMLLVESHSLRQLHGLDVNPINFDEFATIGDDGILRIWSLIRRTCVRRLNVEAAARSLTYSPDGSRIIVGVGGDPLLATKDGALVIIDSITLEIIAEDRKAKQYITDMKYSPHKEWLAVASHDGKLYLHDASNYTLLQTIEIPTKNVGITRFDFSTDSQVVRLSTTAEELFYFKIGSGEDRVVEMLTTPSAVRDIAWSTTTCPYTWLTMGVWRQTLEGINVQAMNVNPRKDLVCVSYQNGDIRLYRFPVQSPESEYLLIRGVATQSSRMAFTADNQFLIIIDTFTRAILIYRLGPPQ